MPRAWRLCKAKWADTAFSGLGASEYPGRWNTEGRKMVYCASSQALAALELLAHVEDKGRLSRAHFVMIPVDIPDGAILLAKRLPAAWANVPPTESSRKFGDRFLDQALAPALRVPSAVVPEEFNYLINPEHPQTNQLVTGKPERFRFDPRLLSPRS